MRGREKGADKSIVLGKQKNAPLYFLCVLYFLRLLCQIFLVVFTNTILCDILKMVFVYNIYLERGITMTNRKNRFNIVLSVVLALCVVLTLLPGGLLLTAMAGDEIPHDLVADSSLTATGDNHYIVTQSESDTTNNIVIDRGFTGVITLKGVNITTGEPIKFAGSGTFAAEGCTIELEGPNKLAASGGPAITIPAGAKVTFRAKNSTDEDTLVTTAGYGAAIGSPNNTAPGAIVIDSGTISATSGNGAGVGYGRAYSGNFTDTFSFTMNGGKLTATGNNCAGIGAGDGAPVGKITINGGTVIASGLHNNVGIGGVYGTKGFNGGGTIVINGGNVTATGGGSGQAGIGFSGSPAGLQMASGSITITGGNIKVSGGPGKPAIGGPSAYGGSDYLCYESIVILPEANISGSVQIGLSPVEHFATGLTGTPTVGNAKNIFFINKSNLTSIEAVGTTPAPLSVNTPHENINVFADFSGYHPLLAGLISDAYDKRDGVTGSSAVFKLGATEAAGDLPLFYYNTMPVSGSQIKFTGSGCADKIMANTTEIASGTVTLTGSGTPTTATPTPGPTAPPPPSANARLGGLTFVTFGGKKATVSGYVPAHEGTGNEYYVTIPAGKSAVYVDAPAAHSKATAVVSPGNSIPVIDGAATAIVTVTAQDGVTTSDYTIYFTTAPLNMTEDIVHFSDGHAGTSSGGYNLWNRSSSMAGVAGTAIDTNAANPAGTANPASAVKLSGNGAFLLKSTLDISGEFVISTSVYAKAGAAAAQIKFAELALLEINGTDYTFGTPGTMSEGWRRLDFYIVPGSGADAAERWNNSIVKLYIDGEYKGQRAYPITSYAQLVLDINGFPYSGWGAYSSRFEFVLMSAGDFYLDEVRIYEPSNFVIEEAITERYNDLAKNVKLNGTVTLELNHNIDMSTYMLAIYEGGELITRPTVVEPLSPDRIIIDFSGVGNAMKQYTTYAFVLSENCLDVTGRKINIDASSVSFTTGGAEGTTPPQIPLITPEEGAKYVMPDEFNTGYYSVSDFNQFKSMLEKYPQLISGSNGQVRITKESIAALKAANNPYIEERDGKTVFSGFKIDGGCLLIEASNVIIEDFYIDSKFGQHTTNVRTSGGATNVVIQDGELVGGDGMAAAGDNLTLKRMHIHQIMADGLKPASNWLVESCYIHDLGLGYLAHADGVQISGSGAGLTNDIRMYGNRIDMPPMMFFNVANCPFFLKLDHGPLTNVDIQYNWWNGGGNAAGIGGMDYLLKDLTYKNNLVGVGHRWDHVGSAGGSNLVNVVVEKAAELETLNIPSAGSVVYKDESGKRIYDLADSSDKLTVMANFANFTTNEQSVKIVAELYDINDERIATASPSVTPIQKYTKVSEYYEAEVWKFVNRMIAYIKTEVDSSFNPRTNTTPENVIGEFVPYYSQTKDYVENVFNQDPEMKVTANWWQTEVPPPVNTWFVGLKEKPYLPLSEQREFVFNLTRPVEAGDYVKVSVYKVWGGDTADELLRPADILECSLEPGEQPIFAVSGLSISGSAPHNISAAAQNDYTTAKDANFIVAVYDGSKLLDIQVITRSIAAGHNGAVAVGSYTPAITLQPTNKIKLMAWGANQSPLCAAFETTF